MTEFERKIASYEPEDWDFLLLTMDGDIVPVNLQEEDDWGDIEPFRDLSSGKLMCTLGKEDRADDVRVNISRIWGHSEDSRFNGKFLRWFPVTMETFVTRLLESGLFHGVDEDEIERLKKEYGV